MASSPVQNGELTEWSSLRSQNTHNIERRADGTFWMWGNNTHGQLGLEGNVSSPVQVGSLKTCVKIQPDDIKNVVEKKSNRQFKKEKEEKNKNEIRRIRCGSGE